MWDYSASALDHYLSPRYHSELEEPLDDDARGMTFLRARALHAKSGDALTLALRIDRADIIRGVGYSLHGSRTGLASASMLSELLLNRHMNAAAKITPERLEAALGRLPERRFNQPLLAIRAFRLVYDRWLEVASEDEKIICYCLSVGRQEVVDAIRSGSLTTVAEVGEATKAGRDCSSCHADIVALIAEVQNEREHDADLRQRRKRIQRELSDKEQAQWALIEEVLEDEIRPGIQLDGGDIELVDVSNRVVCVELSGACRSCPSSNATLRYMVELKLREYVAPDIEVEHA